jgi:hypothetical protein
LRQKDDNKLKASKFGSFFIFIKKVIFTTFLLINFIVFGQQQISKTIESDASFIEFKTAGIDHLLIEESTTKKLEIIILDADFGILENVSCNDFNCVLSITTNLKESSKLASLKTSKVKAIIKIPKGRKVTVFGETININTNAYEGILRILIKSGDINFQEIKGITEVELSTGTIYAMVNDASLDIKTKQVSIKFNEKVQKSSYRIKEHKDRRLIIKSSKANVVLTQQ